MLEIQLDEGEVVWPQLINEQCLEYAAQASKQMCSEEEWMRRAEILPTAFLCSAQKVDTKLPPLHLAKHVVLTPSIPHRQERRRPWSISGCMLA
eukprot:160608-Pyramimonas_sp.AAC.1